MSAITVAGGLYHERCIWPDWDRVYGSGGRAAVAVSSVVERVALATYATDAALERFRPEAGLNGVELRPQPAPHHLSFDYVHPMSVPVVRPVPARIARLPPLGVEDETVLRFGMLEGSCVIRAERCVYDPQSAFGAEPFAANGSEAARLAIVANRTEVMALSQAAEPLAGARLLLKRDGAEVVVVKAGAHGAYVVGPEETIQVPARRSSRVWTIGSGDVFAAAFATAWGVHGMAAAQAADLASRAVAEYAASMALPIRGFSDLAAASVEDVVPRPGTVYLAGPFFTVAQRWLVDEARRCLDDLGLTVFSPVHDVGHGPAEVVAPADMAALDGCDLVFALLDGLDSGTLFELGYARALGKPVYGLAQATGSEDLKMLTGTGCRIYDDLVTAMHHAAWRA